MYQHPATLELMASYHQDELLREAEANRLAHQLDGEEGTPRPGSVQRRMIAVAVALLTVAVVIALI